MAGIYVVTMSGRSLASRTPTTFDAELIEWDGEAAWHFVEVPAACAPDFAGRSGARR